MEQICKDIKDGKIKKIITMCGAGISTNANIPDFRTPGTGLYDNLQQYNLPYAEAIFDLEYFQDQPKPFYQLAKDLWPGNYVPTRAHKFIKKLSDKGLLLRNYTQNIDTLERVVGIPEELLVEAHGSFNSASCLKKKCKYTQDDIKDRVMAGTVPYCEKCKVLVKPDIVFFGEGLPSKFFKSIHKDFAEADLLIIMGTSLTVFPFAGLITKVGPEVPRILINKELVGVKLGFGSDDRDVKMIGDCDEQVLKLENLIWD